MPPRRGEWDKPHVFRERERITRATYRAWVDKGVVAVRRVAPRTGVQVRYKRDAEDAE
jgi:hypothetical protein